MAQPSSNRAVRVFVLCATVVPLTFALVGPAVAQSTDTAAADSGSLQTAVKRLEALVDEMRPRVEAMESREAPPTAEEVQRAQANVERLRAAVREVERLMASSGTSEPPETLRAARKLLRRIAALELLWKAAELRSMVEELDARPEPPTDAEIEELRRRGLELQDNLERIESAGQVQPSKESVREAERAVAMSGSVEVHVEAGESSELLESIDSGPTELTEEENTAARRAAGELHSSIEQARKVTGTKKGDTEPAGLKRARGIVNRLLLVVMEDNTSRLRPELKRLEGLGEPPSTDELDVLRPIVESLLYEVDLLERNLKGGGSEEIPPQLVTALDLLRRFANLDLARSLADVAPFVLECEEQQDPLAPEQIGRLREIPKELRPKKRSALRTAKKGSLGEEDAVSPEVIETNNLLQRVQTLVPDSPVAPEEPVDAPNTRPILRFFRFYGSLRLRTLVKSGKQTELDGQTSRIGVRVEGLVFKKFTGYARGEMGFNFLEATNTVLTSLDEGRGLSEEGLFFTRLAFVGAEVGQRSISFGKQWSTFYDIGVFSDQMPFFAGEGTAVYAAGSDGGVAGTGRADQALQYRDVIGIFKYGVQVQIRNLTENNKPFADTVGGSLAWQMTDRTQVGGAFNRVRDGVPDPGPDEPRDGDRAFIVGYRYKTDELYGAATLTLFNNHDTDNLGVYFGGVGLESYIGYSWSKKLLLRAALSFLNPNSDYPGQYRVLTFTSGASYDLTGKVRLLFLTRLDFSKLADGADRNADTVSLSVFYNF